MITTHKNRLLTYYQNHPFQVILLVALLLRILAAFFSKGYAFFDDHFSVLRVANHWALGIPHWLDAAEPPKHSMIYAGANAAVIWLLHQLGFSDPIGKATVLRIIHAFYSMLIVYFSFKITNLLSSTKNAIAVGWILAVLWFMPFLSVKFLAELVCLPPILAAFYYMLKSERDNNKRWWPWLLGGVLFGVAFSIRLHTVLFAGGMGMVLLWQKRWLESVVFTAGFIFCTFLIIGIPDIIFFDYPYHYVINYFVYNSENANNYITGSPFKFFFTTLGFLVPPVSIFLIWGYSYKSWKVDPKLFVAVLLFFLVHSFFPNKQERFLLPMYPLMIVLGVTGWNHFLERSPFWTNHQRLYAGLWKFFWIINVIAAVGLALTFSKKDRIAPLYYLSHQKDVKSVIIESERGKVKQPAVYYLGGSKTADYNEFVIDEVGLKKLKLDKGYLDPELVLVFHLGADKPIEELQKELQLMQKEPNYVIFNGQKNFELRKSRIQNIYPDADLRFLAEFNPSFFDRILHFLNPRIHKKNVARVYRIER